MAKTKRTTCPECGESYDILLSRCPHCHCTNDERPRTNVVYLPIPHEISLFLIGLIGLNVLAVIFSLIFQSVIVDDKAYSYLVVNSITYATLFVIDIVVVMKYYSDFLKPFTKWRTYIAGVIGFAALYLSSVIIGIIMETLVPSAGTGENQSVAIQMVLNNPGVCVLVLGIIGPFVEECAYRIGLFSLCRRASRVLAYAVTIVVFALIHMDFFTGNIVNELVALPDYVVAATIFCVLYDREGFGAVFLAHCLNNILSVIMIVATQK